MNEVDDDSRLDVVTGYTMANGSWGGRRVTGWGNSIDPIGWTRNHHNSHRRATNNGYQVGMSHRTSQPPHGSRSLMRVQCMIDVRMRIKYWAQCVCTTMAQVSRTKRESLRSVVAPLPSDPSATPARRHIPRDPRMDRVEWLSWGRLSFLIRCQAT